MIYTMQAVNGKYKLWKVDTVLAVFTISITYYLIFDISTCINTYFNLNERMYRCIADRILFIAAIQSKFLVAVDVV
jgi:hypothetical protein